MNVLQSLRDLDEDLKKGARMGSVFKPCGKTCFLCVIFVVDGGSFVVILWGFGWFPAVFVPC